MPILKKRITSDFTTVHNAYLRDSQMGMKERGLLTTMLSMAENWHFSIRGLMSILPDGDCSIRSTLNNLEKLGYLRRIRSNGQDGRLEWEYHFTDGSVSLDMEIQPHGKKPCVENPHMDNSVVEKAVVENQRAYKISNKEISKNQISKNQSINQSNGGSAADVIDKIDERERYEYLIKDNIEYEWFEENVKSFSDEETLSQVDELIEIMLDVICSSKKTVRVNGEEMPRETVKSVFLKLKNRHIQYVLESLQNKALDVMNPRAYTITTLFNSFQTATLNEYIQVDFSTI